MTQNRVVLNHMQSGNGITSLDAFKKYQITRLARVIHDLRTAGYDIKSTSLKTGEGKIFTKYTL